MWQFICVSKILRLGGLLCVGLFFLADTVVAQPGAGGTRGRGGFSGFNREPSLSFELRNDVFAAKMKITEQQQQQLNEIDMQRREYLRNQFGNPSSEKTLAKLKEFETAATNVLDDEQKSLWEARKVEIKAEQVARERLTIEKLEAELSAREAAARQRALLGASLLSLTRELRNEAFSAKMKITEKQQDQLIEIDMKRREYFRSLGRDGIAQLPSEETQAKLKEFETAETNLLDDEQKTLWDARKAEIKAERAAREVARQSNLPDGQAPALASDRDRILALEEEVKALKAEVAKLKEAIAAPAAKVIPVRRSGQ